MLLIYFQNNQRLEPNHYYVIIEAFITHYVFQIIFKPPPLQKSYKIYLGPL